VDNFFPQEGVLFVEAGGIQFLPKENISVAAVGNKAYGILCLKSGWTKPFIVISKTLFCEYRSYIKTRTAFNFSSWIDRIHDAINDSDINKNNDIILRSSGLREKISERGLFCSLVTTIARINTDLSKYLNELSQVDCIDEHDIAIMIQELVSPLVRKGHLSNERHLSATTRDWIVEEEILSQPTTPMALRKWRQPLNAYGYDSLDLGEFGKAHDSLKIPAFWAHSLNKRIHFEWATDEIKAYIVQADEEDCDVGDTPKILNIPLRYIANSYLPKLLQKPSKEHFSNYPKILNINTYKQVGFHYPNIFILDDIRIIKDLSNGIVSAELEKDLRGMVNNELVIRMDINTQDQAERQMLPRGNFHSIDSVLEWLKEKSAIHQEFFCKEPVFILHNFIPAQSSSFALAKPNERKVLVESLWGLPEGLYYFAHDKYIVDTCSSNIGEAKNKLDKFRVKSNVEFKSLYVFPDSDTGEWTTRQMASRYGRHQCLREKVINFIALKSREIAESVGEGVSIMWFVGVDENYFGAKALPWHHEVVPFGVQFSRPHKFKYPSERIVNISSLADIENLEEMVKAQRIDIRVIKILPMEDALLRNKKAISRVGACAVGLNAVIHLEGGILSHAAYQLKRTGANVEIKHLFSDDDKPEYNKLVRDDVPKNIYNRGEEVEVAYFTGRDLIRLLKTKLLEEALEVQSSENDDSLCEELADMQEVIDALIEQVGKTKTYIQTIQEKKRKDSGGFKAGVVLLKTRNPKPVIFEENRLVAEEEFKIEDVSVDDVYRRFQAAKIVKDIRKGNELLFDVRASILNEKWKVTVPDNFLVQLPGKRLTIECMRDGAKQKIRLVASPRELQGSLMDLIPLKRT